ncbi:hypothetical protein AKJ38_00240 [candidate division MSBL1 archaeon SCGC-AAA259I14]|uniref:Uncharacterized protein n=1 Tax=candidate division MSBL1 archaeon SCGC-AAA259I14 TaxID=1698268 RepID=A0A133UUI4_9EURY|nr:hypothetical protein AKJ38_00240 [candidate division MSBL1 archaeon SCGC-AAA259I14]
MQLDRQDELFEEFSLLLFDLKTFGSKTKPFEWIEFALFSKFIKWGRKSEITNKKRKREGVCF